MDADLDWVPAIPYAHRLLPTTHYIFGRRSKLRSHYFYTTSEPVITKKFKFKGTTYVERRGLKAAGTVGHQTVLPHSHHYPSGETVTHDEDREIAHDDTAPDAVALYAAVCLLGSVWPKNGPDTNQHDVAGYAAGFLCQHGVDPDLVPTIIEVAAESARDDNVTDRVRFATGTVDKFRKGQKRLAGGPKLAKEIGEDVVAQLKEWLDVASATKLPGKSHVTKLINLVLQSGAELFATPVGELYVPSQWASTPTPSH